MYPDAIIFDLSVGIRSNGNLISVFSINLTSNLVTGLVDFALKLETIKTHKQIPLTPKLRSCVRLVVFFTAIIFVWQSRVASAMTYYI